MQFVVIARDKSDPALRLAARADHLKYIATQQDKFIFSGPLIEDGRMVGSLSILDVPDRETLESCVAGDPYVSRGVFEEVQILETRWMVPEQVPGALAAEAEKALLDASGG